MAMMRPRYKTWCKQTKLRETPKGPVFHRREGVSVFASLIVLLSESDFRTETERHWLSF